MFQTIYQFVAASFILFSFSFAVFTFNGCTELDEMSAFRVECGCGQTAEALIFMEESNMSELTETANSMCQDITRQLTGKWTGQGDSNDKRLIMKETGEYKVQERRGSKWATIMDGNFHVEYEYHRDELRTVLHMSIPDSDDYAVRFRIDDDELHLDEPFDGGNEEMVFKLN